MKSQLFIPQKIKVGYQERSDTYTKKLGYVIYYDLKGVLRKEKSWRGWIQSKLGEPDFDNIPTEGFVLNKDAGGKRNSWSSWNTRMEKVRVYDPRGFEFEISIPNLLFILQECTSSKGKGLEGEFVYSWDGTELILLPVACKEYQDCAQFTAIQGNKVTSKDMIPGHTYMTKKQESVVYMGKFPWTLQKYIYGLHKQTINTSDKHIFYNEKDKSFFAKGGFTDLAAKTSDLVPDYANRMDKLEHDAHMSTPVSVELSSTDKIFKEKQQNSWVQVEGEGYLEEKNGNITAYRFAVEQTYDHKQSKYVYRGVSKTKYQTISVQDNKVITDYHQEPYRYNTPPKPVYTIDEINKMGFKELFIKMKNGKKIKFSNYNIN